jgi:hypothetical protein
MLNQWIPICGSETQGVVGVGLIDKYQQWQIFCVVSLCKAMYTIHKAWMEGEVLEVVGRHVMKKYSAHRMIF